MPQSVPTRPRPKRRTRSIADGRFFPKLEGPGTTETGAYTLTATGMAQDSITRNTGITWAVASEDEWYKAAFYNPPEGSGLGDYWFYTTSSNSKPGNALPDAGNNANYYNGRYTDPVNFITPVGAFAASASPYGTFDQGGNVWQWTETIVTNQSGSYRLLRGGCYGENEVGLQPGGWSGTNPTGEWNSMGFRLVNLAIPEPASLSLLALGTAVLLIRRRAV